jgi:intein/homing endonuclease
LLKDKQLKAKEIKAISLYLKKLEKIATLSRSVMRAISIYKLLKKIKNLNKISRDNKFSFKERAAKVLKKWKAS